MMRRYIHPGRWEKTPLLTCKEVGSHFKGITRQILSCGFPDNACQLRYFEIAKGGYSTLEWHEHSHQVMIIRGRGEGLVNDQVLHSKPSTL